MERVKENMAKIKHKIMVMSGKGGVGKTTVAVNLALALAENSKVGLLDTDINGPNVPKMLGIEDLRPSESSEGITPVEVSGIMVLSIAFMLPERDSPVIWRGPLKMTAIRQFLADVAWGDLDYLIVDLPPGTGDEPLSTAQLIPDLDGAIIVTTPQEVSTMDSRKAVNFAKKVNIPVIGIIENMSGLECPHCHKKIDLFKTHGGETVAREMGVPFLGRIPIQPEIVESSDAGKPFINEYPKSEATESFKKIIDEIKNNLR